MASGISAGELRGRRARRKPASWSANGWCRRRRCCRAPTASTAHRCSDCCAPGTRRIRSCRRGAESTAERRSCVGAGQAAGADPLSRRALLRRRELLGPSGRNGRDRQARHRQGAVDGEGQRSLFLHEDHGRLHHRHRYAGAAAAVLKTDRLGGRTRRRDRQSGPQRLRSERLRRRRRLYRSSTTFRRAI